ncbi:UNVERIFIED_CONTAM: hypothetical protein GTU68_065396 [Idotea baltica]|nr:hypothetical protein [Idotea baltica]
MENNNTIWIVGCGDIGRRVAALYQDRELHGIVSSAESASLCEQLSIYSKILDLDSSYSLESDSFSGADIYYFAPPPPVGAKDTRLKRFLNQISEDSELPRRLVMISTTGVYGDSGGEWIDENTPVNPKADRAVRRVSAEQILQRWSEKTHCSFMILRVPGIYAEDRLPLARLEKNLPIVIEAEAGYTNRIHADDLARACKAAMDCDASNQIINVTDGNPSTMTDYFNHVADYAKLPRPPQISLDEAEQTLSAGMVSYLKESRRIKNDKMLKILGFKLLYPSLKASLKIKK